MSNDSPNYLTPPPPPPPTSLLRKAKSFFRCHLLIPCFCGPRNNSLLPPSTPNYKLSAFSEMGVSDQLEQVFHFIDANGDGKISSVELGRVLFCLGNGGGDKSKAAKEAEVMVTHMDSDGDGLVDMDEFTAALTTPHNHNNIEEEDEEEECLKDAFLIFDTDNNGLISAKELHQVLTSLGIVMFSDERRGLRECGLMIQGVDRDGDGFVDFHDFRSMMINA